MAMYTSGGLTGLVTGIDSAMFDLQVKYKLEIKKWETAMDCNEDDETEWNYAYEQWVKASKCLRIITEGRSSKPKETEGRN